MKYDFEKILKECSYAYNTAAKEQIKALEERGPLFTINDGEKIIDRIYDVCGTSFIEFNNKEDSFCTELKEYNIEKGNEPYALNFEKEINRKEFSINKAAYDAVAEYLKQYCKDVVAISEVDK